MSSKLVGKCPVLTDNYGNFLKVQPMRAAPPGITTFISDEEVAAHLSELDMIDVRLKSL